MCEGLRPGWQLGVEGGREGLAEPKLSEVKLSSSRFKHISQSKMDVATGFPSMVEYCVLLL